MHLQMSKGVLYLLGSRDLYQSRQTTLKTCNEKNRDFKLQGIRELGTKVGQLGATRILWLI
jgi:hypothetical protein